MAATTYRFLPWARRGLAARVADADAGSALAARAQVTVGLTVSTIPEARYDLALYGPGDVIGVDPQLIVRTDPRPHSTDVEPNYFPLIEFDPPDFPWAFTPARSDANDRLRPWCVLVVVDLAVVSAPRAQAGQPLPVLVVPAAAGQTELPDLTESWAWAHAQAITPAGTVKLAEELAATPALNVSRIVAPRRLEAGKRYAACLVPAFDSGVVRGLGGTPEPGAPLGPAWSASSGADVRLPVYFHWEFATGPAGDFETLARRLTPFAAPATVGVERMYIGAAGAELPAAPPDDPAAYLAMDGALRAPAHSPGTLGDVAAAVQDALRATLDAAAAQAELGATPTTPMLGAPVYGAWHARQHTVPADLPAWLRELNLDPRARAAAGLGAEIERQHQEEFMQWCWEQVGRILEANRLLSRTRLSLEALVRVHARHFATLPADRLLQMAGPLHGRTKQGALTVLATIARSSLPNASADGALRRLTSAQRPVLRAALRQAMPGAAPDAIAPRVRVVGRLAAGELEVDPTRFAPHGLLGVPALAALSLPDSSDAMVDLTAAGLPVTVPASLVRPLRDGSRIVAADQDPRVAPRANLRGAGMLGETQLLRARELLDAAATPTVQLADLLGAVMAESAAAPGAAALLVIARDGQAPEVEALDVDAAGRVVIRTSVRRASKHVATIERTLLRSAGRDIGALLAALPRNALDPLTREPPAIRGTVRAPHVGRRDAPVRPDLPTRRLTRAEELRRRAEELRRRADDGERIARAERPAQSITLQPALRDADRIARLEQSVMDAAPDGRVAPAPPQRTFVPFAVTAARDVLVLRTDPRVTIPRRLAGMIAAGGRALLTDAPAGLTVAPTLDRVMAAPEIDLPVYDFLARLDPERFLPGVGVIPEDALTLLETNPRFIEALLVGLNSEMNRELLWRAFPTDQRGTPFRHFWAWSDGQPDIAPIHSWPPANALGANGRSGPGGQIALLVRGRLLRRYPNTSIYAWRSRRGVLANPPRTTDIRRPVFAGVLGADMAFVGFDLTDVELTQGDGWFFVLQQQATEPRFGFDEMVGSGPPEALGAWADATWEHTGTAPGHYLRIADSPLAGVQFGAARFVDHAAHLATITLQKPMRVAVHARSLVLGGPQ